MSLSEPARNKVKNFRSQFGWSQAELAEKAGISRTAVSAIEGDRLVPSVAAALALARVLRCSVEDLFGSPAESSVPTWAVPPDAGADRYWLAEVGGRTLLYPAGTSAPGSLPHDGVFRANSPVSHSVADPQTTLVVACCDPAAGIMAAHFARTTGFRLLVLPRSTQQALDLLAQGLVHVAGLHLSTEDRPEQNAEMIRTKLGAGYCLLRVVQWQEGLALRSESGIGSVRTALRAKLRWVGREAGSGARQCLDELSDNRLRPRHSAHDHRGVAEAIRCGWADAGVCLQIASAEAGLSFLSVREESYDLCFSSKQANDPRIRALIKTVRSSEFRTLLADLPGYNTAQTGALQQV